MADQADTIESAVKADVSRAAEAIGAKASEAADRVGARAKSGDLGDIASEVKGVAGDIKSAAVDQGRQLYETAKTQATGFVDQRKNDAAQSVSDLAASLRETGKTFSDRPNIHGFVGSAADGLEQLADGLRERSFAEIYADVEDYCRRSPVTVGVGAAVAGFLLARFIKSSSEGLSEQGAADRTASSRAAAARRASAAASSRA